MLTEYLASQTSLDHNSCRWASTLPIFLPITSLSNPHGQS